MAKVRDAIGLDIGTSGVRAAHVGLGGHPPTLLNFGHLSLPPGAVRDGEIMDVGTVSHAIGELWRRAGFKRKVVHLGIANQNVVARPIDLPYLPEDELRSALQFQVQDYIPIPIDDAILDFQILDEFVTENGDRMLRIMLVAAHRATINTSVEAIERAGLTPAGIDFIPLSLIRSLGSRGSGLGRGSGEQEAIIDIGAGVTNIVVHENSVPRFARVLSIGGNDLTDALASGLGVSFEDAESIKQRLGLGAPPAAPPAPEPGIQQQSAAPGSPDVAGRILDQRATSFVEEIRGSLDYYLAQAEATRISRVVISGGASKLPGLAQRLANALRLPVEPGRVLGSVKVGKIGLNESQLAEAEPLMAASVGTALGAGSE